MGVSGVPGRPSWKLAFFVPFLPLGWCPSTVRPVFPVLVFQLSKQQNRTRTTSSTVLGTPPNRTRWQRIPLRRALRRFAFLVGFSTENPPKIGTFTAWNRTRNRTRTPSEPFSPFSGGSEDHLGFSVKMAYRNPKRGLGGGYRRKARLWSLSRHRGHRMK